jgi:hypothetical protein
MVSLTRALVLSVAIFCGLAAAWAHAIAAEREEAGLELGIKAAYLYKFLSYIEWPPQVFPAGDAPFVIGVAGADAIAEELGRISAGRTVRQRPVTVKVLHPGERLAGIHLLYIGYPDAERQLALLKAAQQLPIVSVTDSALVEGSVINFREIEGRIRFEVSLGAAEHCGCRLSARMLSVASLVQPGASR